jgi:hypothetical protein
MPMTRALVASLLSGLALSACSSSSGMVPTTLFGGSTPPAPTTASIPVADPTTRAFGVAAVAARAKKCGYNFNPQTLRSNYLASETSHGGATPADMPRIEKIYDTAFNGVTKAIADQSDYCTADRTKEIKATLNRHLTGDFTVIPPKTESVADEGLLSGLWGSGSSSSEGMKVTLPTDNSND